MRIIYIVDYYDTARYLNPNHIVQIYYHNDDKTANIELINKQNVEIKKKDYKRMIAQWKGLVKGK